MLNKVMLIGRLGRDPELRYTQSGLPVATMTIATDETYTDRTGNRQEKTEWHRVVVFQKQAENCANFLGKGSLVYVEGSLQTRKWQDQQGQDRYTTEIKAQRVQFLDRKGERGDFAGANPAGARAPVPPQDDEFGDEWGAGPARGPMGQRPAPGAGSGGYDVNPGQTGGGMGQPFAPEGAGTEDLGPAFPSEASSMDKHVF